MILQEQTETSEYAPANAHERQFWYRLPEREIARHRIDFAKGSKVAFSRYIDRVGYYLEPTDIPEPLCALRARELVIERMNVAANGARRDPPLTEEILTQLFRILGGAHEPVGGYVDPYGYVLAERRALSWIRRQVRYDWLQGSVQHHAKLQELPISFFHLRTFWYRDCGWTKTVYVGDQATEAFVPQRLTGKVQSGVERLTGEHYEAKYWGGGYDSDPEYDPGGLNKRVQHRLFHVWAAGKAYLCHPLDLETA